MNTPNSKPRLWSDFDGTAVEIVSKAHPYNWSNTLSFNLSVIPLQPYTEEAGRAFADQFLLAA